MLDTILLALQIVLALIGGYQLFLTFFGWSKPKATKHFAPTKSFAVLVAAHNEEQVVGALIENLKRLDYPRHLYDIFVICDNCTDNTAEIARSLGVYAYERRNPNLRGKGYAIEWMLKELWKLPRSYDAIVMFDADNLVNPDYLTHMNNDLCNGSRVIQAYLDTKKNPHDSWVTSAYAITYWYCNRLWQLPRKKLKLANYLGGTGMCFESNLLKEMGWGATSLVEDLEFTMRCVQRGIYPTFNHEAKVYDEKPLTFKRPPSSGFVGCRDTLPWPEDSSSAAAAGDQGRQLGQDRYGHLRFECVQHVCRLHCHRSSLGGSGADRRDFFYIAVYGRSFGFQHSHRRHLRPVPACNDHGEGAAQVVQRPDHLYRLPAFLVADYVLRVLYSKQQAVEPYRAYPRHPS